MSLNETVWKPLDPFEENNIPFVLIILNQPINENNEMHLKTLWSKSSVRLCADGAANRLYEWSRAQNLELNYIPDYICGDLDSLRFETMEFYSQNGCKIVRLHNQDLTDFYKTLKFTINCLKKLQFDHDLFEKRENFDELNLKQVNFKSIYIFCNFSGRLDHALANLNTLYKIMSNGNTDNYVNTYIISEESITFLLSKGLNCINLTNNEINKSLLGTYCGMFPLNKPSKVTTNGLKWNLNNHLCSFDDLISSSNEFDLNNDNNNNNNFVYIETENPLLWTMSIKSVK